MRAILGGGHCAVGTRAFGALVIGFPATDKEMAYAVKMPSWRDNLQEVHALRHVVNLEGAIDSHKPTVFAGRTDQKPFSETVLIYMSHAGWVVWMLEAESRQRVQ
jgi:hypothetical protein